VNKTVLPILEGVPNPITTWTYNASSGSPPPPPALMPSPLTLTVIVVSVLAFFVIILIIKIDELDSKLEPAFEPKLGYIYRLKFADASMNGDYKLVRVEKSPVYDKKGKVSGYSACYVMERRPP
jgi:hypothetical protein